MYHQTMHSNNKGMVRLVIFAFLCLIFASCQTTPTEQYGFVTTLGSDTVSLEGVQREGNTVTIDAVDRFPEVRLRHAVIELEENGSIKHLEMDIHTPAEPLEQRERKVVADVAGNTVHLSKTDKTGTVKRDFATGGSIVVAHVPQMYSLYELYFAAAMKQAATSKPANTTPVQLRQFYIDREFDRFPLGRARVQPLDGGKMEITHDWLAGPGTATMDSAYHLLSFSGARTTYKVETKRLTAPPDIKSLAARFEALETKAGAVKQLSIRDTLHAQIGNAMFTVDYGRPLMRQRQLLGDVIPYDRVWRTGANAATQFTTSAPIQLAGMQVPAGSYTLWTIPHTGSVDLVVNKQTGQWGTEYNRARNLGIVALTTREVTEPVEAFTISIIPGNVQSGTLVLEWGNFRWEAPVVVP